MVRVEDDRGLLDGEGGQMAEGAGREKGVGGEGGARRKRDRALSLSATRRALAASYAYPPSNE